MNKKCFTITLSDTMEIIPLHLGCYADKIVNFRPIEIMLQNRKRE